MAQWAIQVALIGQILWFTSNEATFVHSPVWNSFESGYAFIRQMKALPFGRSKAIWGRCLNDGIFSSLVFIFKSFLYFVLSE